MLSVSNCRIRQSRVVIWLASRGPARDDIIKNHTSSAGQSHSNRMVCRSFLRCWLLLDGSRVCDDSLCYQIVIASANLNPAAKQESLQKICNYTRTNQDYLYSWYECYWFNIVYSLRSSLLLTTLDYCVVWDRFHQFVIAFDYLVVFPCLPTDHSIWWSADEGAKNNQIRSQIDESSWCSSSGRTPYSNRNLIAS